MTTLRSEYRLALEAKKKALDMAMDQCCAQEALEYCLTEKFLNQICIVSSFGTESVIILHMVAQCTHDVPILFIDTGKLFQETLDYRETLVDSLELTNVQTLRPSSYDLAADDPHDILHTSNSNLCCHVRKTLPLIRALRPYEAWVSGRKQMHGGTRSNIPRIEIQNGKIKINPIYDWTAKDLDAYKKNHDLLDHPLLKKNYPSVGCVPCTSPISDPHANLRAGRWAGQSKDECGIHISEEGKLIRMKTSSTN